MAHVIVVRNVVIDAERVDRVERVVRERQADTAPAPRPDRAAPRRAASAAKCPSRTPESSRSEKPERRALAASGIEHAQRPPAGVRSSRRSTMRHFWRMKNSLPPANRSRSGSLQQLVVVARVFVERFHYTIRVGVEVDRVAHQVQRPALHLFVDAPDVLAEDADRQQLHTTEKQHGDRQRGPAGNHALPAAKLVDRQHRPSTRGWPTRRTDPACEARRSGWLENPVMPSSANRIIFAERILGRAAITPVAVVENRRLVIAHPRDQPTDEPALFLQPHQVVRPPGATSSENHRCRPGSRSSSCVRISR